MKGLEAVTESFLEGRLKPGLSLALELALATWSCRAETECAGTRKRTGGEVKGKKANGGGSQQSCTVSDTVYPALLPLMRSPRLPAAD